MKKKIFSTILTLFLALACVGPVPALAAAVDSQPDAQSSVLADEFIVYHAIIDGKKYYRIWNATDGRWETPWLPC